MPKFYSPALLPKQTDAGPISFRDWMNKIYPDFDNQLSSYISSYGR